MSELTAEELWEQGIEHHPESLAIQKSIQKSDKFGIWSWGGDGDNGENLLYELDVYFRNKALDVLTPTIPTEDLKIGSAYEVDARNFEIAIWTGTSFSGLRQKFQDQFMDYEYYEETCRPIRELK